MLASLPVCGTEACTVLTSLDSDLYIETRTPDHCGQYVKFVAKDINRNGPNRIASSSDVDGTRYAKGLSWRVAKACSGLRVLATLSFVCYYSCSQMMTNMHVQQQEKT